MNADEILSLAMAADRLILQSRLTDLSMLALSDRNERVGTMAAVLSQLPRGAFLLGCGPYACGVLPLSVDEVVLGRPPSPLESLPDTVADFTINDAVWMAPREVSRIHATICRRQINGAHAYFVRDEDSRNGVYVNGRKVRSVAPENLAPLATGDVISLGPSGINVYVFVQIS
jgi:hypothetical protein